MPEGPELHMAARFINKVAEHHKFGGKIVKSAVSTKNPDISFSPKAYHIAAETRGKELKLFLEDKKAGGLKTHVLFRFGMSGCFKLTEKKDLPKHAHLQFYTVDESPQQVLSFVDYRRFGRWEIEGDWGKNRGPDPIMDYDNFRLNVLDNLKAAAFDKPICEAMLDQKYFNGIGNYLRAEVLFRAEIPPFRQAREVLEPLSEPTVKMEGPDILQLCNLLATEVLSIDKGKNYDPDSENSESETGFTSWLRCYYVEGMNNLRDGKGRTIWFSGDPGPMAPKNAKTVRRKGEGSGIPKSGTNTKDEPEEKKLKQETKYKPSDAKDVRKSKSKVKEEPEDKSKEKKVILVDNLKSKVKQESDSVKSEDMNDEEIDVIKNDKNPSKVRRSKRKK